MPHSEVRSLKPQPRIPAFCRASQETRERAGNPGFSRICFGLRTPALTNIRRKSPKVSGRFREYSRFGETIGRDEFDQHRRPRVAVPAVEQRQKAALAICHQRIGRRLARPNFPLIGRPIFRHAETAWTSKSKRRMSASGGGFNRSRQHILRTSQPASDRARSFSAFH